MATNNNLTVYVKNIASSTRDSEVRDFFSFCGKITDINVVAEGETKSAEVSFEKETATNTALLLNGTQLGSNHISVTGPHIPEDENSHAKHEDSDEITQESKPRSRIIAEYLAHGYVVRDAAIQRAIELDHQHGVSHRFLNKLRSLDERYGATDRAKATDQQYGISKQVSTLFTGLNSYFEQAQNTPTGKRVVDFYTKSYKEVGDIHKEARRLADIKTEEHGGSAYKAAGLEKIFGAQRPAGAQSAAGADASPTEKTGTEEQKSG